MTFFFMSIKRDTFLSSNFIFITIILVCFCILYLAYCMFNKLLESKSIMPLAHSIYLKHLMRVSIYHEPIDYLLMFSSYEFHSSNFFLIVYNKTRYFQLVQQFHITSWDFHILFFSNNCFWNRFNDKILHLVM